jgi:hypothetical protein
VRKPMTSDILSCRVLSCLSFVGKRAWVMGRMRKTNDGWRVAGSAHDRTHLRSFTQLDFPC